MKKKILLITSIVSIGFILNLVWEIVQMPLYAGGSYLVDHLAQSLYATLWDATMILAIYLVVAVIKQRFFWVFDFDFTGASLAVILGLSLAIFIELRALREGRWGYSNLMPIIPFTRLGLSPIIQMVILPKVTYYLSGKFLRKIH